MSHSRHRRIQGGQGAVAPQGARKWHKINIFQDIRRKQRDIDLEKFGLYYLVGSKEAKPDAFSEIGVPF